VTAADEVPDDAQRFTLLYREHHVLVRDFARRRIGLDLAQEIVAETFLVAWRRLDDIPVPATAWLYRVALYEIANLRRRQAKAFRLQHTLLENGRCPDTENTHEDIFDLAHAVAAAFETLKPRDQEILRLAAWERLSSSDAAAVLGCSVSAYRMRLHRARLRLATKSGVREQLRPQLQHQPLPQTQHQQRGVPEPAPALSRAIALTGTTR
jgi:RNA polymerase sigma-70 factor (ECF subfamily)